jgi:hypothetical protein
MLTQDMLNTTYRNEGYLDILMFVQDKNVRITNVTSNSTLSFSNLSTITNLDKYNSAAMATLERNLWILDGTFFNPNKAQIYDGYISSEMSDDNGDFKTNPVINLTLLQEYSTEYFSLVFNPAVQTAYPKKVTVSFSNNSGQEVLTRTVDISEINTLPNLVIEAKLDNVKSVKIEFIGTQVPHRRIRLSTAMFGKLEMFNQERIVDCDWNDKCSLVADTLPSRIFSWKMTNYDKKYNIDNPSNELPVLDRSTEVMLRWGYKTDGGLIEWTDMKHLRLLSVSTNNDDTATFEAGSNLDMMDAIFDRDVYNGERTTGEIVRTLLNFVGADASLVIYDGNFENSIVDRPLPEQPVRELLQLLAFGCGATLQILDNGQIKFADISISNPTSKATFTYNDFASIPRAEQLEYTSNVALTTTTSSVEKEKRQLVSTTITTQEVSINYGTAKDAIAIAKDGTIIKSAYYTTHCELEVMFAGDSCEIEIQGYGITTATRSEKWVTSNTLVLDSQMARYPNETVRKKYADWYDKRFKYIMTTRGEPLVNATDIVSIQTPFTEVIGSVVNKPMKTYVLQNHITYDGAWGGDMEVIVL